MTTIAAWFTVVLIAAPLVGALGVELLAWAGRSAATPWADGRAARYYQWLTVMVSVISLLCTVALSRTLYMLPPDTPIQLRLIFIEFYLDALSIYFLFLINVVAFFASIYTSHPLPSWVGRGSGGISQFHFFFNLFHFTMLLVPIVDNLVLLWIAVELTTVTSTILVGFRGDQNALEAAWKYIITTSTGIIFALLGTLFLANAIQGDVPISMNWSALVTNAAHLDKGFVRLSFLFVLVGYGTKAGLAPMHTWLPDGHGEAPSPISALLSGVLLKTALYAILRFYIITNRTLVDQPLFTSTILLGAGLLSLVLATPLILKRNRFKRVLAYHSLEHMGIITFGIGIGGFLGGSTIAIYGALLHALNHALTKTLMFLGYGTVQEHYPPPADSERNDGRYQGVLRAMPITGLALALGGLALVGSPPFNIFFSEFLILWGALQVVVAEPTPLLVGGVTLFLVTVSLIFAGLMRHLGNMLLGTPPTVAPERWWQVAPLLLLMTVVILFGVMVPTLEPLQLRQLLADSAALVAGSTGGR